MESTYPDTALQEATVFSMIPKKLFFTKGIGIHKDKLQSFENALRDADLEKFNLVHVSSIFPPQCEIIERDEGLEELFPGQILHCVMSRNETSESERRLAAAIGLAVPEDRGHYGYISEHHSYGETGEEAGFYAEDLAATMLATTFGFEFDADKDYDERKEIYRMSGKIVTSEHIVASTKGAAGGVYTTVLSAAVFIL